MIYRSRIENPRNGYEGLMFELAWNTLSEADSFKAKLDFLITGGIAG